MELLFNAVVDWSRAQFALTAMYHWLFVPLTIGLSLIVAIMETIYVRTGDERWKAITKFWMTLFGINFACGIATGIILEFEFGTNWSNYSWFVGDIFGAPLAIEGIVAFFMEATFVAVMFFGWKKVSKGFHLASTWLTAIGVSLSALWILVANAWMQYPAGMEFDPAQMRNVMVNFTDVISPLAINKFFHAVTSGWLLAAVFVLGVSAWLLWRKSNVELAQKSIGVAAWVGLAGGVLVALTGHGSAVQVAQKQPMKLAAMEGLYNGTQGQSLVAVGILNPAVQPGDSIIDPMLMSIDIPYGLSLMIDGNTTSFVPGINDLIAGVAVNEQGDTIYKNVSYAQRIEQGRKAIDALKAYGELMQLGDTLSDFTKQYFAYTVAGAQGMQQEGDTTTAIAAVADLAVNMDSLLMEKARAGELMAIAKDDIDANYAYFGYGFLDTPSQAVPPVGMTFYAFRIMVAAGGFLLLLFVLVALLWWKRPQTLQKGWMCLLGMLSVPVVWVCSQAGWIVAEVGRQPWVVQDKLPSVAAVSQNTVGSVQTTFWIFAVLFTALLIAEISIMLRFIGAESKKDILSSND